MEKLYYYSIVFGTVFVLVGIFGWIFRESFGQIPAYHLVIDIVFGLLALLFGFRQKIASSKKTEINDLPYFGER